MLVIILTMQSHRLRFFNSIGYEANFQRSQLPIAMSLSLRVRACRRGAACTEHCPGGAVAGWAAVANFGNANVLSGTEFDHALSGVSACHY